MILASGNAGLDKNAQTGSKSEVLLNQGLKKGIRRRQQIFFSLLRASTKEKFCA
jgi:hypothetical protein